MRAGTGASRRRAVFAPDLGQLLARVSSDYLLATRARPMSQEPGLAPVTPLAFGIALERPGGHVLWISGAIALLGLCGVLWLRPGGTP